MDLVWDKLNILPFLTVDLFVHIWIVLLNTDRGMEGTLKTTHLFWNGVAMY